MLFHEMERTNNAFILDVKKTCYPNPVKTNTILIREKQMQYGCNNKLKQVLRACLRQRLREFNGANY